MQSKKRVVSILGATGSIGQSTLDVIARHPERYEVFAISGASQCDKLVEIAAQFHPKFIVVLTEQNAQLVRQDLVLRQIKAEVLVGEAALIEIAVASEVDTVMAAIVGAAGMPATLAAAKAGKRVLLANKETLVLAGKLFMDAITQSGAELLPIDSEHNAIYQSLPIEFRELPYQSSFAAAGIEKLLLTASGGPFRTRALSDLSSITPEEAIKHPNWSMGRKISVDSASLMNKGLEVIEAHWLFNAPLDAIEVVVHPQSVIHSMVQYRDGSVIAQLGSPDMRTPIAYGLAYPERIEAGVKPLDLFSIARLDFEAPDMLRFPCLGLAYNAIRQGGAAPAVLNAANEIAVESFLAKKIAFTQIPELIESTLNRHAGLSDESLESLLQADQAARKTAIATVAAWS
ncbi:1-deoxy-D-xylulose-5-phosphate reductoisomerase [Chitinibacter bivalviorum]|uniref:1-deoxy-D-xylulose 5-phosphate reductoisomerase n=1 Tax=Chitinibacter bivalviorum TaxID=2739434 RepID=A0A7H9BGZ3_9NEIS|nr:1-deoxy-D-xylulose-5-phosphate reductoisomerase [Chitinibacter bivalviorum]QLG87887.1 1-deoxy-D-xylulose-5-phosphate reductoisomerase [Chitinibacter bivalviorum]